jgi:single-stranded DNA-binding protein
MGSLSVNGIARITRDPEQRPGSNGTWYSFGLAVYRKNALEGKQSVDFFDADLYVKETGVQQAKGITKGRLIYIESAYLRNDEFTGQDGTKKTRIKLQIVSYDLLNDKTEVKQAEAVPTKTYKSLSIHPSDLPPPINIPSKKERFIEEPVIADAVEEFKVSDKTNEENPPF